MGFATKPRATQPRGHSGRLDLSADEYSKSAVNRQNRKNIVPISSQILSEENIDEKLDFAIRQLLANCYQADKEVFKNGRTFNGNRPAFTVILLDDGMVCAHAAVIDATILVEQSDFKVAGLGYLCVAEQSRGQNLGRRIADIAMQEADRRKFDIGLLFTIGTLPKIYSPLGWKLINKEFFYLENDSQKNCPQRS